MDRTIKEVMADVLDLSVEEIGDATSMDNVEGWDSLQHINLVVALEDALDVEFEEEHLEQLVRYRSILEVVQSLKAR